jgi:tRNA pseudouridine32 synthase/23S rRNA pseudouridine746 synthase/23S rRNA pseudouridine1911/1915/1917 synthase
VAGSSRIPLVLYKDALMLVVDKPAGIPVHAGPGGGPNLEQSFGGLRFGRPRPPALAHRLDRDTSGCLVLGRHPKALRKLGRLFSDGRIEKVYWAVVEGAPPLPAGRVELALRKETRGTGWRMVPGEGGQSAVTEYRTLGAGGGLAWLELRPRTGRTHQIRVHCASLGCPVLGDAAYGAKRAAPLHLHSRAIVVPLYPSRDPIRVEAPLPAHMKEALAACGWSEGIPSPQAGEGEQVNAPARGR